MMNWLGCSLSVILTPIVVEWNGDNPYPIFLFFGGVTLLFFFLNVGWVVETKGKNAREIAELFQPKRLIE